MALILLVLISFCVGFGNAQEEFYDMYDNCNETGNCNEVTSCIRLNSELRSYILRNEEILDSIEEGFFQTGRTASSFVKITYNFQVCYTINGNTDTIESDSINCSSQQSQYIWGNTVLILLGPKPLQLLTLFAVNVPKANIIIKLPCLCDNAYNDLLSRLTYMVRMNKYISING